MKPSYLELRIEEGEPYRNLNAVQLVIVYANLLNKGPCLTQDGLLRHRAKLDVIKDNLVFQTEEDKLNAYVWLISEKYTAEDEEDFEKVLVIRRCQEDLEDRLHNIKNMERYITLEEFFEQENIENPHDYLSRIFEKSLLANLKVNERNGYAPVDVYNPIFQVAIIMGLLKEEKEDVRERYINYFNSRDNFTKKRQELGIRKNGF